MVEASVVHTIAWLVALAFVGLAVGVSVHLILAHHRHFVRPIYQRKIVGILWMVPIYAADSWISLRFPAVSIYLDLLRDMYEAYVIYLFMALMIAYLGAGDEGRVVSILEGKPPIRHMWPCCLLRPVAMGASFLRTCKFAAMQFVVLKPLCTLVALALESKDVYGEGELRPNRGYPYLAFIMNASITYAFYWLAMFYLALKKELAPFSPVPKFLCIKAVLFMTFWQSVMIAGLVHFNLIHEIGTYTTTSVSRGLQNLLICFEMFLAAIAHRYAFTDAPFRALGKRRVSLLQDNFASDDLARDFNDVMPVVIPTRFSTSSREVARVAPPTVTRDPSRAEGLQQAEPSNDAAERGFSVL